MIPKIIHYCWLGGEKPADVLNYIDKWKKLHPDYTIKEWNETNFDIRKIRFVHEAYMTRQYAFCTDYMRLYALYYEGGVYLDTDVEVLKPFDSLLDQKGFAGYEYGNYVGTGVMGLEPHQQWIKEWMQDYESHDFISWTGKLNNVANTVRISGKLRKYGFPGDGKFCSLTNGLNIYPIDYFCAHRQNSDEFYITENTFCIHHFSSTWLNGSSFLVKIFKRIRNIYKKLQLMANLSAGTETGK